VLLSHGTTVWWLGEDSLEKEALGKDRHILHSYVSVFVYDVYTLYLFTWGQCTSLYSKALVCIMSSSHGHLNRLRRKAFQKDFSIYDRHVSNSKYLYNYANW